VSEPDVAAGLRRCGVRSLPAFLAHELLPMGVLHATPLDAEVHTLLRPRLSALAARAFFAGAEAELPPTAGAEAAALGARNSLVRRLAVRRGGRLRGVDREQLVRETCTHRPSQCLALLAEWVHDAPSSGRRERILFWLRGNPILSRTTPLDLLEPLAALHRAADGEAPLPVENARRNAELFARHYHHAAPFPREALERLWRRCEADAEQLGPCAEARAQVEGRSTDGGEMRRAAATTRGLP
jgi:hypothetical protein